MTGHRAYCCEVCDDADPHWHIMRRGDVVVSWACDSHLSEVCERLQRDREVTELIVSDSRKARSRAKDEDAHQAMLDRMAYGKPGLNV